MINQQFARQLGLTPIATVAAAWKVSQAELQSILRHYNYDVPFDGVLHRPALQCLLEHYEIERNFQETAKRLREVGRRQRESVRLPTTVYASLKAGGSAAVNLKGVVPSFSGIAHTGGPIPGYTGTPKLESDYVVDLAGLKLGKNPKVNLGHDKTKRVGHVTKFYNDGRQLTLAGLISAATEFSKQVAESAKAGYTWELSIEAGLFKPERLTKGDTANVNARQVAGPLIIFRASELTGLAFVDAGADRETNVEVTD